MWMPDEDRVYAHGLNRQPSVEQRLALLRAAAGSGHGYNIGAENFPGLFEGHASAGAGVIE